MGARTVAATFQVNDVEELLTLMEQWGIAEVHLTVDGDSLDLVRAAPPVHAPVAIDHAASEAASVEAEETEPVVLHAPAVGVFHLAVRGFPQDSPHPGDQVQAGQVIGTIELMHVPSDLIAPVSGTIEGILTDDGAGVEYGQPLMVIRPFEEVGEDEAGMLPPPR